MPRAITLLRSHNRVVVEPTTPAVQRLLVPKLTCMTLEFLRGKEAKDAKDIGLPVVRREPIDCYIIDAKGRIATTHGLIPRIRRTLEREGYTVAEEWPDKIEVKRRAERAGVFTPDWNRLYEWMAIIRRKFRYKQEKLLVKIAVNDCGIFKCPPAYGKSFLIACASVLFPAANILVVSRGTTVIREQIYKEMVTVISDVGMIGGGIPINPRARVTCCTVGSLHRVLVREWDIIFFDEVHQAPTDDCAYKLGQLRGAPRLFGFSASHGDRGDNKDLITESIFGPVRLAVSFEEAVAHGMIVPIEVIVRPVNLDINPCAGCHPAIKERLAYWTNTPRNQMVIEDARAYPDVPVLVTCKTIEHLANLKALCPEMVTIHAPNGMTEEERERYVVDGLWPADEPALSVEMYEQRMARLRSGVPGIYGINSKGFVGLNAKKIAVVVRADGAGSKTLDTQIPGRAVRVLDPEEGDKTVALIHDYSDNFDRGCHNKSTRRITNYETNNFKVSQRRPKSLLRRLGKK